MEWQIKKYSDLTIDELYSILKVRNEVFVVEQNCPYQDCDEKDKQAYHLFLDDNGDIIAYTRILEKSVSYDEISIGRFLVKEEYRRKGLAKELLVRAMNFIEESLNEKTIRLSGQVYIKDLYKSFGFKEVSDIYLEDDLPHVEMLYNSYTIKK
ncbi:MAG: GNAT family N-acetyltransferase [Tissierellales bacterium]